MRIQCVNAAFGIGGGERACSEHELRASCNMGGKLPRRGGIAAECGGLVVLRAYRWPTLCSAGYCAPRASSNVHIRCSSWSVCVAENLALCLVHGSLLILESNETE
jgi:hypothetical protein